MNAPEVSGNNALVWRCYWDLRRGHDNLSALRWTDVLLWANTYGCSVPQMEGLQTGVVVLDAVWLPHMRAKDKAARDAAAAKNGGK